MSHADGTTFRCDRCQKRADEPQGSRPRGWRRITSEPLQSDSPVLQRSWELCDQCAGQVDRLLEPVERVADMQRVAA